MAARLKKADDGRPRLFLVRDALVERDEKRAEAKLPTCSEEEFDAYLWDTSNGRRRGGESQKLHDHGRYMVAQADDIKHGQRARFFAV